MTIEVANTLLNPKVQEALKQVADGREFQRRESADRAWYNIDLYAVSIVEFGQGILTETIRVKPKPIVQYALLNAKQTIVALADTENACLGQLSNWPGCKIIKLVQDQTYTPPDFATNKT